MNNNTLLLDTDLTPNVKYNGRDYRVQSDKNGFRYIKVSENGKRVIVPVRDEPKDEVFDYIFNYGFRERICFKTLLTRRKWRVFFHAHLSTTNDTITSKTNAINAHFTIEKVFEWYLLI